MAQRVGVLLINTGTPDEPSVPAVRRFLREFLSDPHVVDINSVARSLLLNLIILPSRPKKSAEAYRAIWRPEGSPLLYYGTWLRDSVGAALGADFHAVLAMRYGNPSLGAALDELGDVERLVVLPLFPQWAAATTGSALEELDRLLAARRATPTLLTIDSFHSDPGFIGALAAIHERALRVTGPDHVLFSFHGLPERQVRRSESADVDCDRVGPCPALGPSNERCYRAQCYATARALAAALDLPPERTSVSFQSRMGRAKWIGPHTEELIGELRARGVERLVVSSPAFVADCLETLEELGIRLERRWRELGGTHFELVPCLNVHPAWIEAVVAMIRLATP